MKTIKTKQFIDFMNRYPVRQFPLAGTYIVNQLAYEARQQAIKEVDKRMILRNTFVRNRIQFAMAPRTLDPRRIKSEMGALTTIDFMADQEYGYLKRPTRGQKLPVPTRAARVGKNIERKKRTVYQTSKMPNLRKINRYKGKNRRQKIVAMLQDMAAKKDKRPALVPFTRKPGIYVVRNIRRRKRGTRFTFKMMKLYDLSKGQIQIKANPWMRPTVRKILKREGEIADRAWKRFLSRL